jgi:hypothetical protein
MKASTCVMMFVASLITLGGSLTFAGSSDEFKICKSVKLIEDGKESVVTLCEKEVKVDKDTQLRPVGRVSP